MEELELLEPSEDIDEVEEALEEDKKVKREFSLWKENFLGDIFSRENSLFTNFPLNLLGEK